MKLERIQILSIVLLLGSFLYLFEIAYHGFVHEDFSKAQIILTFLLLSLSAGFLLGYQVLEKKIGKKDLVEMFSFFGLTVILLFSIFYTRNKGSMIPLLLSTVYFSVALFLIVKKDFLAKLTKSEDPMVRFSSRFFIVLGIMILPAAGYEFGTTGAVNFRLDALYMPLIGLITTMTKYVVGLLGVETLAVMKQGGYDLISSSTGFKVFVGAFCSGVTSMSVFIAAFFAISGDLIMEKKQKAMLFAAGILGTFFANVIRVVTLFMVGYYYGADALLTVHTHLGWIIFFIWISVFWMIALRHTDLKKEEYSYKRR